MEREAPLSALKDFHTQQTEDQHGSMRFTITAILPQKDDCVSSSVFGVVFCRATGGNAEGSKLGG